MVLVGIAVGGRVGEGINVAVGEITGIVCVGNNGGDGGDVQAPRPNTYRINIPGTGMMCHTLNDTLSFILLSWFL
jgi:hypothetical protein